MNGEIQRLIEEAVRDFAGDDPGRSVAVRSLRGLGVAASVRADVERPGASLLKLPLVLAVYAAARAGQIDLSASVDRRTLGRTLYASVLDALSPDHRHSVQELCRLCLITSDNPISDYLLGLVGREAVNDRARLFGCRATRLEVGFSDEYLGEAGRANLTTAHDSLELLARLAADEPEVVETMTSSLRNFRIPLRLPPTVKVAHKTGTLPGVANDAGVILGRDTDLAVAFVCDAQQDTARTSIAIGDCVARMWSALGEEL